MYVVIMGLDMLQCLNTFTGLVLSSIKHRVHDLVWPTVNPNDDWTAQDQATSQKSTSSDTTKYEWIYLGVSITLK